MLDDKKRAELDQASASLGESFPLLWRSIYRNCLLEGFDKSESFRLVQTYILSNAPNGIRGVDGDY